MKTLILLVATFVTVAADPISNFPEPDGWFVHNRDGSFEWVTREQYEDSTISTDVPKSAEVKFYLYTKSNPDIPKQLYLNDKASLSSFRKTLSTKVIIHDWDGNFTSPVSYKIRNAYLSYGFQNIISIDWSDQSVSLTYTESRNAVPAVGKQIANFLDFLSAESGMAFSQLIIIGYGLGAHIAGFAGKQVTGGKVKTIYGLDPAYPLFSYSDCSKRLCSSDATYVESTHTSGGLLGFLEPIGQAAFYPNGGISQPTCGDDLAGLCSHERSYEYFVQGIHYNNFVGIPCPNYDTAVKKKCGNAFSLVRMGTGFGYSGIFYVPISNGTQYGTGRI